MVNHIAAAHSRLVLQMQRPNFKAFLTAFGESFNGLEVALTDLLNKGISYKSGHALEQVGALVGQPRGGLSDDVYRRHIRAKIKTNRSNGNAEDLIRIVDLIAYDDALRIVVTPHRHASLIIELRDSPVADATADTAIAFLKRAKGDGVRLILHSSAYPENETFRLNVGPGLNVPTVTLTGSVNTVVGMRSGQSLSLGFTFATFDSAFGLSDNPPDFEYGYDAGVTTAADFEAAINASAYLYVVKPSTFRGFMDAETPTTSFAYNAAVGGGHLATGRE